MTQAGVPQPMYLYPAPPPRTNGLAIASFVLGLCGFALLPVILGHVALRQIRERGDSGSAFAIIGLVLGYVGVVAIALLVAFFVFAVVPMMTMNR